MLLDRRACLRLAASVLPFARPNSSPAAGTIAFTSPELQYLEPIYELKFSLDALRAAVETPTAGRTPQGAQQPAYQGWWTPGLTTDVFFVATAFAR